jgi:gamma-glutamyltranspeptidase/glutathione hydrolase
VARAPLWGLFIFWLACSGVVAAIPPRGLAVATAHPLATEAGLIVMEAGGNAFDAAVAVSAALAVVEPSGSGLGGGGFWLLHRARDGRQVMLDGRERAPAAASADMYLDPEGEVIPKASIDGPLAAGIPGVPAALEHIARRYGRLPLDVTLAPAIILARDGFPVDALYRKMAGFRLDALRRSPAASDQFLLDGEVPPEGHLIRQPDLAATLGAIARDGAAAFYTGPIARQLIAAVRDGGGIWTAADLRDYRVIERPPLVVHHRGRRVVSASLPSSGGVLLAQMLLMLERYPIAGLDEVDRVHLLVEVMRRAYADRAQYLGDADFVEVPLQRLLDRSYAHDRAQQINLRQATPSGKMAGRTSEGRDTTHFSILDQAGNRVAATLSINYPFGSGFVAAGTGVLLNDEMDDFSVKPGAANAYGLVGNHANAIAPGKRMLSSMSPTFVEGGGRVVILGTPGGSRIISMVLLALLDAIEGRDVTDLVSRPRFHHQYLPDRIDVEPGALSDAVLDALSERGHTVRRLDDGYGNMQAVAWDLHTGDVSAASDPRGMGRAAVIAPDIGAATGQGMAVGSRP